MSKKFCRGVGRDRRARREYHETYIMPSARPAVAPYLWSRPLRDFGGAKRPIVGFTIYAASAALAAVA